MTQLLTTPVVAFPEGTGKPLALVPAFALLAEPIRVPQPGRPWSVADLLALADDERHFELVRGELMMMSSASPVQGRHASRLAAALQTYVDDQDLGEVYTAEPGFELRPDPDAIVRAPDIAFVQKDRIPPPDQQSGFWKLAPDLAVEIISPSETADMIQEKVRDYLDAGTKLIWLVYLRFKMVTEYQSQTQIRQIEGDDSLDGGTVIPGFQYPLHKLFCER